MLTHQEWLTLLGPVLAAVFGAAALLIGTAAAGLNKRLAVWLEAKAGAEVSKQVTDAATRMQNAMANEAGQLVLEIGAGHLDVTDLAAVRARAEQSEQAIKAKLPDAVALLKPLEGAIAGAIVGKLGTLTMTAPAAAVPA